MDKKERRKLKITLFASYILIISGVTFFFIGMHSIDLAQHYFKSQTDGHFNEINAIGWVTDIDSVYMQGMSEIIMSFFLFGGGSLAFGEAYTKVSDME